MTFINLQNKIERAQTVLSAAFGNEAEQLAEGFDVYRYLNEDGLAEAYMNDLGRVDISEQLLNMAKSIKSMRSSYLPMDFFLSEINSNTLVRDISGESAKREPYENTFMRMLGMPVVSDYQYGVTSEYSSIPSNALLYTIDPIESSLVIQEFELIKLNILEQRKKSGKQRRFLINNSIYNISPELKFNYYGEGYISLSSLDNQSKADLLSLSYDPETGEIFYTNDDGEEVVVDPTTITGISLDQTTGQFINPFTQQQIPASKIAQAPLPPPSTPPTQANIGTLSNDLYKFSYLLVPPIQDPAIANAINEPEKLVLPPFSGPLNKKVNSTSPKPSLLESIIRIRLDRVSGTSSQFAADATVPDSSFVDGTEVTSDDYGILESLFIVRLRSAILGLSNKMVYDIDKLIDQMDRSRRQISEDDLGTTSEGINLSVEAGLSFTREDDLETDAVDGVSLLSEDAADNLEVVEDSDVDSAGANSDARQEEDLTQSTLVNLKNQELIEDSMMFLLARNSEVLDLQAQTQRNSGIHDSHMMGGLINIVDVPRKRIKGEIDRIVRGRDDYSATDIESSARDIGSTLGTDIGIGTLDLAVFALALFTISEESLLGLLSEAQFERIKNGDFKNLITPEATKKDVVESINELSLLVFEGYELFKAGLLNTDR